MSAVVSDNTAEHCFEQNTGDHLALLAPGLSEVPQCPFISAFIAKNTEINDLVA